MFSDSGLKHPSTAFTRRHLTAILAGPEPYLEASTLAPHFIELLGAHTGVSIDLRSSRVIHTGRAGGIDVIDTACKYFASTDQPYALIGGVDSFYDRDLMQYLDRDARLLKYSALDGFVPGEGAGFLLLIAPDAPASLRQSALATLSAPGITHEKSHRQSKSFSRTESLASAWTQTIFPSQAPIDSIVSSENGERYYAQESQVALTRHQHRLANPYRLYRPAEYFGDVGAAFGPVAIGLACAMAKEKAEANRQINSLSTSLVYSASDSSLRAALCVTVTAKPLDPKPLDQSAQNQSTQAQDAKDRRQHHTQDVV